MFAWPPFRLLPLEAMTLDRADAAWVGPVRAVLWGCKTVPCVSLCVRVFFDDDKLLTERSHGVCASIAPAPTDRLVLVTVWCLGSAGPVHRATVIG